MSEVCRVLSVADCVIMKRCYTDAHVAYTTCQPGQYETTAPTASNDRVCATCLPGQACSGSGSAVDCGSASLFAAGGASTCTQVSVGYYSTPSNGSLSRRTGQEICPIGSRCQGGVATLCTNGTLYQSQTGQTSCLACQICAAGLSEINACTSSSATVCYGKYVR